MKFVKVFVFAVLLCHFYLPQAISAETKEKIIIKRTAHGVHFYGYAKYPHLKELVEEMHSNSYNLLDSGRAQFQIQSFNECRHKKCDLTRSESDSCERMLALENLVKLSVGFLKDTPGALTVVFYAGGGLFSELQLLTKLYRHGITMQKIIIIDPIYEDFIEQFSVCVQTGKIICGGEPRLENNRIRKLLDIASSLNGREIEISVYKSAAEFAAEVSPTPHFHHLIMAMDYQSTESYIHKRDFDFLRVKLIDQGIIGMFNGAWLQINQKTQQAPQKLLYFENIKPKF